MRITHIDVYLSGDGYVVAPAGVPLPGDTMHALGKLQFGWSQEVGGAARLPGWRALRVDMQACGYGIVSGSDFTALLMSPLDVVSGLAGSYSLAA